MTGIPFKLRAGEKTGPTSTQHRSADDGNGGSCPVVHVSPDPATSSAILATFHNPGVSLSHSHEQHSEHHKHSQHAHGPSSAAKRKQIFMLIGIGLMLLAMIAYIMSMDEAIQPDGEVSPEVPADAGGV